MNNKMKRLTLISIFIVILIIVIIIALLKLNKKGLSNNDTQKLEIEQSDKDEILDYNFYQTTDIEEYCAVEKGICSYLNAGKEKNSNNVLKLLNKEYIKEKNIDNVNLFENIKIYPEFENFFIDEIYYSSNLSNNDEERYGKYLVHGTVWNNSYNSHEEALFQVNIDLETYIFDISPLDISILDGQSFEKWITKKQIKYVKEYKEKNNEESSNKKNEEETTNTQNDIVEENTTEDDEPLEEIMLEEIPENEPDPTNVFDEEEDLEYGPESTELNYLYLNVDNSLISERIIKKNIVNALFNNGMEKTYDLLTEDCKNTYFKSSNDFSDFVNKFKDSFLNLKVTNAEYEETESEQYGDIYKFTIENTIKFYIYTNNATDYRISITK